MDLLTFILVRKDNRKEVTYCKDNKVSDIIKDVENIFSLIPKTFVLAIGDTFLEENNTLENYDIHGKEVIVYMYSHSQ